MKKLFSKKLDGVSQYVSATIAMTSLIMVFMGLLYIYVGVAQEEEIHRLHRKYLLSMEREGCLTSAYESALRTELTSMGASNIDLSGTSFAPVGYGNTVVLSIKCDIRVQQLSHVGNGNTDVVERTKNIEIKKEGTAFY